MPDDKSTESKLNLVLEALALMAISTEDVMVRHYCAKILEDLGEFHRVENFIKTQQKHN